MTYRYLLRVVVAALIPVATGAHAADPVIVPSAVPYADSADIQQKILDECTELGTQFSQFIKEYAAEKGVEVTLGEPSASANRVLRVEITHALSQGNAFLGHSKSMSSRGTLFENGVEMAGFRATRNSMGGAFAGYKGSCSVLGRTVKAMGMDIGEWLADPVDGAELGDR